MPADGARRFAPADLVRFLTAIDGYLDETTDVVLLGGSALAFYGVDSGTRDLDTWEKTQARLEAAADRAREATGLEIPLAAASVADVPWGYEDRLVRWLPELPHLRVFVLERHDLALSKIVRGYEPDVAGLENLHRVKPLDLETLSTRYIAEMDHAIGDAGARDRNLIRLIHRLFGEIEADRVRKRLGKHRRRRV